MKPTDVEISIGDDVPLRVETFAILRDQLSSYAHQAVDGLFKGIRRIELRHGVSFIIEFPELLTQRESKSFLRALEDATEGGVEETRDLDVHGIRLQVLPGSHPQGGRLRGPAIGSDLWPRMIRILTKKAEQAHDSGACWLRCDALQGLWQFTPWAALSLREKLHVLGSSIHPWLRDRPHVTGVVISSGCALAQGQFEPEECFEGSDAGLRRLVEPLRVRETFVITRVNCASAAAFLSLYRDEPSWLNWALSTVELGPLRDLFPPTSTDSNRRD